ncbi:MAG: hypothetical protein MI921_15770 [Cytophagales bacterium]|nr:hypothetical protein [Cytophagales bacterium]
MNNHLKLHDFTGRILTNAVLLGPIAMLFFFIFWLVLEKWHSLSFSDVLGIFLFGCIICIVISIFASIVVYGFLIPLALKKQGSAIDHFKRFLPVLVALFPVGGSLLLLLTGTFEIILYNVLISAYLTSALGWYWLSRTLAKKQQHSNT